MIIRMDTRGTHSEPLNKRAIAFIDGQNLFHALKKAFGRTYPDYEIKTLTKKICDLYDWKLEQIRFYTGVHDYSENPYWHNFWALKIARMRRQGIWTYTRLLRYQEKEIKITDEKGLSQIYKTKTSVEKGIDVRIAIDILRLTLKQKFEIALIFSQDQDLREVADEIKEIAVEQSRWIRMTCAFPDNSGKKYNRGIDNTTWIKFDQQLYERCIDPFDYKSHIEKMRGQLMLPIDWYSS